MDCRCLRLCWVSMDKGAMTKYSIKLNSILFVNQCEGNQSSETYVNCKTQLVKFVRMKMKAKTDVNNVMFEMFQKQNSCNDLNDMRIPPEERMRLIRKQVASLNQRIQNAEVFGDGVFSSNYFSPNLFKKHALERQNDSTEDEEDLHQNNLYEMFDADGVGLFEKLLKNHMQLVAIARICTCPSREFDYVEAEIDLASTFSRIGLWKQTFIHAKKAEMALEELQSFNQKPVTAMPKYDKLSQYEGKVRCDPQNKVLGEIQELFQIFANSADESTRISPDKFKDVLLDPNVINIFANRKALKSLTDEQVMLDMIHKLTVVEEKISWGALIRFLEDNNSDFQSYVRSLESSMPQQFFDGLLHVFSKNDLSDEGRVMMKSLLISFEEASFELYDYKELHFQLETVASHLEDFSWSEFIELAVSTGLANDTLVYLPRIYLLIGKYHTKKGNFTEALGYLGQAVADQEKAYGPSHARLGECYRCLGEALVLQYQNEVSAAKERAHEEAQLWLTKPEGSQRLREMTLNFISRRQNTDDDSQDKKKIEISIRKDLLTEQSEKFYHPPATKVLVDATGFLSKSLEVRERKYGSAHPEIVASLVALGNLYIIRNELTDSVKYLERAIECQEKLQDQPNTTVAVLQMHLGRLFQRLKIRPKAAILFNRAAQFYLRRAQTFPAWDSTRLKLASKAIEAWKYWLEISSTNNEAVSVIIDVLQSIVEATGLGFGEYSTEKADALQELGTFLVKNDSPLQGKSVLTQAELIHRTTPSRGKLPTRKPTTSF